MSLKSFIMKKSEDFDKVKVEMNDFDKSELKMNLKDKNQFNYIVMNNPNDSKFLYVINELKVNLKKANRCYIVPEENDYTCADETNDSLNIRYEYYDDRNTNIIKGYMKDGINNEDLFNNYFAILIPGGSLKIYLEDAVEEAVIKVGCTKEII